MTLIAEKPVVARGWEDTTDILRFVWRNSLAVVIAGVAAAFGSAIVSLSLPERYTTTASFVADQGSGTALSPSLLGIATTLGVPLGGTSASPQFYAEVAKSQRILEAVATFDGYPAPGGSRSPLAPLLRTTNDDPAMELDRTDVRSELPAPEQDAPHAVPRNQGVQAIESAHDGNAENARSMLARVVVQEAHREQPQLRVVEQLPDRQLARVAGAVDCDRLAPAPQALPHHGDLNERRATSTSAAVSSASTYSTLGDCASTGTRHCA